MPSVVWEFLGKAVAFLGATGLTAAVIARWMAARVTTRLELGWKHEYDKRLEEFRASIGTRVDLVSAAVSAATSGHLAAQERRLKAVETLWASVLSIRDKTSSIIMFYSIMLPGEYPQVLKTDLSSGIPSRDKFLRDLRGRQCP